MPLAMLDLAEPELSIIRLTGREREELARAEAEIGETIGAFLRCGAALSLIRRKRLYRETHATFDRYVEERWGVSKAAAEGLLSSYHIAEGLQQAGVKLSADTLQSSIRPLAGVPGKEGLRAAVWQYASSLCPVAPSPPAVLLRRIVRTIKEALASDEGERERADKPGGLGRPLGNRRAVDERFLRAVTRMASYSGFCVPLIAAQVQSEKMAGYVWRSCERLKERLNAVECALESQFPHAREAA